MIKKREHWYLTLLSLLIIAALTLFIWTLYVYEGTTQVKAEPVPFDIAASDTSFTELSPKEGLKQALVYYNIQHPEIVYAQAMLESGLGESRLYKRTNNLFGLYDSKHRRYYSFNHWHESVKAYRDKVQYRYKPPEDYYVFLSRIRYATDPRYISKLKQIVKNNAEVKQNAGTGYNQ